MSAPPVVGILMGSDSDLPVMADVARVLEELQVPYDIRVLSAHRSPEQAVEFARTAEEKGYHVIVAGAGGAAHLAGVLAAHTLLPVIGVPLSSSPLSGFDALLSTVQMPPGIPVATVGVGPMGARNAGWLAATILARTDGSVRERLRAARERMTADVLRKSETLPAKLRELLDGKR